MKLRNVPAIPTIIVAAAVAIMIGLGVWQLGKVEAQKETLKRYELAAGQTEVRFPIPSEADRVLYRRSSLNCERVIGMRATAGKNMTGAMGWMHIANCVIGGGREAEVALGWTRAPEEILWTGGEVAGVLAPTRKDAAQLVADEPPIAGLEKLPAPDPTKKRKVDHIAYAGQWFFFALTALIIYILAVRSKQKNAS